MLRIKIFSILLCSCFMLLGMIPVNTQLSLNTSLVVPSHPIDTLAKQKETSFFPLFQKVEHRFAPIRFIERLIMKHCLRKIIKKPVSPETIAMGDTFANISLAAGILSVLMLIIGLGFAGSTGAILAILSPLLAAIGLVLGIIGLSNKTQKKGAAIIGLVLNGLVLLFFLLIILLFVLLIALFASQGG